MLVQLTTLQVDLLRDQIVGVYAAAFSAAPYFKTPREAEDFGAWLPHHMLRPAFRFVASLDERSGALTGFAYGYASVPGQWWHDQVSRELGEQRAAVWLANGFQLSELAVTPAYQGQGLGALLHDTVLGFKDSQPGPLPNRTAVLSTMAAETVAYGMYCRRGWQVLLDPFSFPGVARVYRILGKPLSPAG